MQFGMLGRGAAAVLLGGLIAAGLFADPAVAAVAKERAGKDHAPTKAAPAKAAAATKASRTGKATTLASAAAERSCVASVSSTEYKVLLPERTDAMARRLAGLGLAKAEAKNALDLLRQRAGLKDLRTANRLVVARETDSCSGAARVTSLTLAVQNGDDVTITRGQAGKFELVGAGQKYAFHLRVQGRIEEGELVSGLIEQGIPPAVAGQVADSVAHEGALADAQVQGMAFDVLYQVSAARSGSPTEATLTVAELGEGDAAKRYYYYKPDGKSVQWLDSAGKVLAPQTVADMGLGRFIHPLPQGRFTSGFGWRRHPVLKVAKFHEGVDFSAPRGTPVVASGDGVVLSATRHRTYGKIIRIKHDDRVETTYSHLDNFAARLTVGQHVRQGQVIGYVGRTGLSSGNHLLFELLVDGEQVDPMVRIPALAGIGQAPGDQAEIEQARFVELANNLLDVVPAVSPAN